MKPSNIVLRFTHLQCCYQWRHVTTVCYQIQVAGYCHNFNTQHTQHAQGT